MANASRPPARATSSHSTGAPWSPASENGVVKMTGSGFHDGPVMVERSRWATSRPQMIQPHGSYVGTGAHNSGSALGARHTRTSSFHGRARDRAAANTGGGGASRSS